jgi:hypothetical protein
MFLRNIERLSTDYTALYPRRQYSTLKILQYDACRRLARKKNTKFVSEYLGVLGVDGRIILKLILRKKSVCGLDLSGLEPSRGFL